MGAASAVGLAVSVVRAIIHGGRSLLTHCRFPDAIGYSSVTNECPFDPTRIYVSPPTATMWRAELGFFSFLLFLSFSPFRPRPFCCNLRVALLHPNTSFTSTGALGGATLGVAPLSSPERAARCGPVAQTLTPTPVATPLQAASCQSDCQSGSASAGVSATPALQAQPHVCSLSLAAASVV